MPLFANYNLSQRHHNHFIGQQASQEELLAAQTIRFTYSDFSHF
jgi:hypothetical protein